MFNRRIVVGWIIACASIATAPAAEAPKVANRWALLVGVDDYAYAQKLNYCGADQVALSKQLVEAGFRTDQVFLLHDQADDVRLRPSKANIDRHLDLILNLADADDLVVIGFSGHGVHLNGKSFLCPGDCNLDDPATLVAVDAIYDRLTACAANFKLVVVDACRNDPRPGGTRSMTATDGTRALARTLQELKLPQGVVLLNSCAPGEVSWEEAEFGHGVFMHYLLNGLHGEADVDGDGHVSLNELQAYAGTNTKTYVANRHRVPQRPFFKGDLSTEALEFALLPVPGGAKPRAAAVPDFPPNQSIKPNQPWAGVMIAPINGTQVVITGIIADGPAAKAGLRVDDVIVSVGGKPVGEDDNFVVAQIASHSPQDVLEFEIDRDGRRQRVATTLESIPADGGSRRKWLQAASGDPNAMLMIGFLYQDGYSGFARDVNQAATWLRKAAEQGEPRAYLALGKLYYLKKHGFEDRATAVGFLEQGLEVARRTARRGLRGDIAYTLWDIYSESESATDQARGLEYVKIALAEGNWDAEYAWGYSHEHGLGVAQDYQQAMEHYLRGARQGVAAAECGIGLLIYRGDGVQEDPAAARGWFYSAAEHGNAYAMYMCGVMNEAGEGGAKNVVRAVEWYRKAASYGNENAQEKLK